MTLRSKAIAAAFLAVSLCSCGTTSKQPGKSETFPDGGNGRIAIVAHRGFWNCEAGGYSENSIASLKAAQDYGLWGSECDVQLTRDNAVIVNHNPDIDGALIREHTFNELTVYKLPNGERRPLFEEYLAQAAMCPRTKLVVELKKQTDKVHEDILLDRTIEILKAQRMYDPEKIVFITFSPYMCERIAKEHPQFVNQFLTSSKKEDMRPARWAELGINGIDYKWPLFELHPDWVKAARDLGMSVNAWTVDDPAKIDAMIGLGVDQITTNDPLLVRQKLGTGEFRNRQ